MLENPEHGVHLSLRRERQTKVSDALRPLFNGMGKSADLA
jgi:hypothetical protein